MSQWLECRACRRRRNRVVALVAIAVTFAVMFGLAATAIAVGGPQTGIIGTCGAEPRTVGAAEIACEQRCSAETYRPEAPVECLSTCWTSAEMERARVEREDNEACELQTKLADARGPVFTVLALLSAFVAFVARKRIREVIRWGRTRSPMPFRDAFRCPEHGDIGPRIE